MHLFQIFFDKGLAAAVEQDKKMAALDFLMYQFQRYTKPSMLVWQQYAYDKLIDIDKKAAKKRMAKNLLLLFDVQNKIIDLVENAHFENISQSYIDQYIQFQSDVVSFGNTLLEYSKLYDLKFNFSTRAKIEDSIAIAKCRYKQFMKKYKR